MKRRALIIYCDDTRSGKLPGPSCDNINLKGYLKSNLGGNWHDDEIYSLHNPTEFMVQKVKNNLLNDADYTFVVFSGHGGIDTSDNRQYVELSDRDIPISSLVTSSRKQAMIIDACRGYFTRIQDTRQKNIRNHFMESFSAKASTRPLFENAIKQAEEGLTILFSASKNQTSLDTNKGGAYLLSLLAIAENWERTDRQSNIMNLQVAHLNASEYITSNFETIQKPTMNDEKRRVHFPFAVKY